jgi:hypothetical protein
MVIIIVFLTYQLLKLFKEHWAMGILKTETICVFNFLVWMSQESALDSSASQSENVWN